MNAKFKAWNEALKCWVEPTSFAVRGDGVGVWVHDGIDRTHHMAPHYKIIRFTGMHDKSGKEIWEGDIVTSTEDGNLEVEFRDGRFGVEVLRPQTNEDGTEYYEEFYGLDHENDVFYDAKEREDHTFEQVSRLEVLGNIYENPELLK